jgi:hypothetical protein
MSLHPCVFVPRTFRLVFVAATFVALLVLAPFAAAQPAWNGYAHDPQHTAISEVASQSLQAILWSTPVDLQPVYSGTSLLIHYGTPLATPANTILVPVKTGRTDGFQVEAHNGGDGSLKWTISTDYSLPPHNWTPSFAPTLAPNPGSNRLYLAGAGGSVIYRDNPDAVSGGSGRFTFYNDPNYLNYSNVKINTPITADKNGNIYFGFQATGTNPLSLPNGSGGIARIDRNGTGTWMPVGTLVGVAGTKVAMNSAPALSNDGSTVYFAVNGAASYMVAVNSTTLAKVASTALPSSIHGSTTRILDDGTSSPTVGPDGKVYYGMWGNNHSSRGYMLQFDKNLTPVGSPGAFGWDITPSIVPRSMVPSYTGGSDYLIMTKYNDYPTGLNKLAILDPNATMNDPSFGTVMKEVLTISGVTPDPVLPRVREWCINTAAVDPATDSILANSEDGSLYR